MYHCVLLRLQSVMETRHCQYYSVGESVVNELIDYLIDVIFCLIHQGIEHAYYAIVQ